MITDIKTVAIVQSNYIPWKGYFDLIHSVDAFVLYDDAQFTRRDWRNRNRIKTPRGIQWLTIPVEVKGKYHQKIKETRVSDPRWPRKHWATLQSVYAKAPCFEELSPVFEETYLNLDEEYLSGINLRFIIAINRILGIDTPITFSGDYELPEGKSERLLAICKQLNATHYLSGPAAKTYLDEGMFNDEGVEVKWMDYSGYPEYDQLYPPFEHGVSILDLLFHVGRKAQNYMLSFGKS